jgi:two-component system phosphate regulon sensor histidine kinase PhoR
MIYNPKMLAMVLSFVIAIAVTVLMWVVIPYADETLLLIFLFTLVVGFIGIYVVLDRWFFRKIERLMDRLRSQRREGADDDVEGGDPFIALEENLDAILRDNKEEIERLKKLEVFRKDFIANVSHELKTPIFAAQGFVHTLLDGAVTEKGVRKKFLKKAAKSLDALDTLVQDLLTLSQIETGQIKMRFEAFDLYALTEEILEQFREKANKKDISLRIEGAERRVMVLADPLRIGQVITNLVSNAIKHSHEGGDVVIDFKLKKKSVVTAVKDRGEGIPEEHIGRIFERFYRVDKSRSREKGGTGLGLAIVKHILDGHNTIAEVESKVGKGSTFKFKLPRASQEDNGIGEYSTSKEQAGEAKD